MKHFIFSTILTIWKTLPFKPIHASIIKSFPTIREKLYKDLRFKGEMKIKVGDTSLKLYNPGFTTIENEIFWLGIENGWEKISMKLWMELVKSSNNVLDIGANTGVYSLVAASINSKAKVYAFEPVKRTNDILKRNLELNPNLNIQLVEKAVSNRNSVANFYDLPTASQYSASLNAEMLASFPNRISYEVETIQLDSFIALENQKIDLIKLDVEMHEPEALEGMMELIKKNHPFILIEILTDEIGQKIQEMFSTLDYNFYNIDEINIPNKVMNLTASTHYNYLFAPRNKKFNFDFLKI